MTESNEFNDFMKATPEYAELMSILESTKKEISKLQVNVQASVDLKNLPEKELTKKVDWMINNNQKEETRDEYLCCLLSDMTEKSSQKMKNHYYLELMYEGHNISTNISQNQTLKTN